MAVGLEGKCGFKWQCRKNLEFSTSTCESGEEFHVILRVYVQGKKLFRGEAVRVGGGRGRGVIHLERYNDTQTELSSPSSKSRDWRPGGTPTGNVYLEIVLAILLAVT